MDDKRNDELIKFAKTRDHDPDAVEFFQTQATLLPCVLTLLDYAGATMGYRSRSDASSNF